MSSVDEIIARMLSAANVANQAELLRTCDLSPGSASQWKKRDSVPDGSIGKVAALTGVSFHWLKAGEGEMYAQPPRLGDALRQSPKPGDAWQQSSKVGEAPTASTSPIDKELLRVVIEGVELGLEELGLELKADKKAQLIITIYEIFEEEKEVDQKTILKLIKLAA